VAILGQTELGPYALDISSGVGTYRDIEDVFDAWWDDTAGNPNWPLQHKSAEEIRRDYVQWYAESPGQPTDFWIDGGNLMLFPAPNVNGTLWVICSFCIPRLVNDSSTVRELPEKFHPVVAAEAALFLARSHPRDVEMAALVPALEMEVEKGILDTMRWYSARRAGPEPGVVPFNRRQW
jgi:hypothetical protein